MLCTKHYTSGRTHTQYACHHSCCDRYCCCPRLPHRLAAAWGQMTRLELDSFTSAELPAGALRHLGRMTKLQELTIKGSDKTPVMLQVHKA